MNLLDRIKIYKIANIVGIAGVLFSVFASSLTIWSFFNNTIALPFIFIAIGIIFLYCLYRIFKLNDINRHRFLILTQYCHSLNHDIRDFIFDLDKKFKNGQLTKKALITEVEKTNKAIINYLVGILEASSNENVYANIKWFDPEKDNDHLFTLCRSDNTPRERLRNKEFKIHEYCGLDRIFNHGCHSFYAPKLKKAQKYAEKEAGDNHIYKRSSEYSASIVVPIRIENKYVSDTRDELIKGYIYEAKGKQYYCLGFLCVDSPSVSAFRKNEKKHYIQLMKCFSNALYQIYEKFHYIHEQVPERVVS